MHEKKIWANTNSEIFLKCYNSKQRQPIGGCLCIDLEYFQQQKSKKKCLGPKLALGHFKNYYFFGHTENSQYLELFSKT